MADFTVTSPVTPTKINDAIALTDTSGNDRVFVPAESVHVVDAVRINIDKPIQVISLGNGTTTFTTLIDDTSGDREMLVGATYANQLTRLSGFKFTNGSRGSANFAGVLKFYGAGCYGSQEDGDLRVDHCAWDHHFGFGMFYNGVRGVVDHCTAIFDGTSTVWYGHGAEGTYGDAEWTAANDFGTNKFLVFENIDVAYDDAVSDSYAAWDGFNAMRPVVRHSTLTRCHIEAHGTESGQRKRGSRAGEIYNLTIVGPLSGGYVVNIRSGVWRIHDITATNMSGGSQIHLTNHRLINSFSPWGFADGSNQWDVNVANGPFATGGGSPTHSGSPWTAASGGTLTVTVAGTPWTPGEWADYSIKKLTVGTGAAYIVSNTNNTITFHDHGGYSAELSFTAGDTFEIYKVSKCMDQPGRSGGSLISGDTPSPPVGWNDQVNDPCYGWNNTANGSPLLLTGAFAPVEEGVNYINGTAMPGVSDFTYPHPLVGSSPPPVPNAPTNLVLTPFGP